VDRVRIKADDIAGEAAALFAACSYSRGQDGGNLWGVCALMHTGIGELTAAEVFSAANGARLMGANKPAYFYRTLSATLSARGVDLRELLQRVLVVGDGGEWPRCGPMADTIDEGPSDRAKREFAEERRRRRMLAERERQRRDDLERERRAMG